MLVWVVEVGVLVNLRVTRLYGHLNHLLISTLSWIMFSTSYKFGWNVWWRLLLLLWSCNAMIKLLWVTSRYIHSMTSCLMVLIVLTVFLQFENCFVSRGLLDGLQRGNSVEISWQKAPIGTRTLHVNCMPYICLGHMENTCWWLCVCDKRRRFVILWQVSVSVLSLNRSIISIIVIRALLITLFFMRLPHTIVKICGGAFHLDVKPI